MKILFQGDSITEWHRDVNDPDSIGDGYVAFAIDNLKKQFPEMDFQFFNRGISGNRTRELLQRWQKDTIDIQPDIMTLMIGVNDTWRRYDMDDPTPVEEYEQNLRTLLDDVKANTNAKLLMIEPFLAHADNDLWREDFYEKVNAYRRVAKEYADAYLPMDGLYAMMCVEKEPTHWSADGVHLIEPGNERMGLYVSQMLAAMIEAM